MEEQTQLEPESNSLSNEKSAPYPGPGYLINPVTSIWQQNRLLLKGFVIGVLILLMLIPTVFIQDLVKEREARQDEIVTEVSSKWASAQTVSGPLLMVPYTESYINEKGVQAFKELNAYFLPQELNINGHLQPEIRKRSLYEVVLYRSDIELKGKFVPLNPELVGLKPEQMLLDKAKLLVGITDARGMEENIAVEWNGISQQLTPGTRGDKNIPTGLSTNIFFAPGIEHTFSIHIKLKGSSGYYFAPSAIATTANLKSDWKDPAFDGSFLPSDPGVTQAGFAATWKILGQNAGLPPAWKDEAHVLTENKFGVNLIQPTNGYAKTMRSAKYAILFIGLTFALFFFIEIMQKKGVHPVQYVLIGLALTIFYTLLLSFSEYLNFDIAYCIATLATVLLITFYAKGIFHKWKLAGIFGIVLLILYSFIYVLIQAQDNALLFGSIGLFLTLAVIMYYSRKINWYGETKPVNV